MGLEKIWGISQGEYSDYQVLCLCKSKKVAEKVAKKVNENQRHDDARVESFLVFDESVTPREILSISQILPDDRSETPVQEFISNEWPWNPESYERSRSNECRWSWQRPSFKGLLLQSRGGTLSVWGLNHEQVRKVFTEKRAMLKATPSLAMQDQLGSG